MNFIPSADDYGLTARSTLAITELVMKNKLRYVSVLANMPHSKSALNTCKTLAKVKWGIHINLIEGKPLSRTQNIQSLVNHKGEFFPLPIFLVRLYLGKILPHEIEIEIENQIRAVRRFVPISHINSHQNIHLFYPISLIIAKMAHKYHINKIRTQRSVDRRLKRFPLKFLIYKILLVTFQLAYPSINQSQKYKFNESIIHPGTSYD